MTSEKNQSETADSEDQKSDELPDVDFHGAAIIDEDGNEVPITETMIKEACEKLEPGSIEVRIDKDEEE